MPFSLGGTTASNNLYKSLQNLQDRLTAISTGYQINRASDNAANLQISEVLSAQVRGMNQAIENVQTGTSMLSVAEGGLSNIQEDLQRVRELTVQASSGTLNTQQRAAIQEEINGRLQSINRTAGASKFNGTPLLSADAPEAVVIQAGANGDPAANTVDVGDALGNASASALGVDGVDVSTADAARAALENIDDALAEVSERRVQIGAYQNQFESAASNLSVSVGNVAASLSQIRDADIAVEILKMSQAQVLAEAQISMFAQTHKITRAIYSAFD